MLKLRRSSVTVPENQDTMQPTHNLGLADQKICTLDAKGEITAQQCEVHVRLMVSLAHTGDYHKFLLDLQETSYTGSVVSQYIMAYERAELLGVGRAWKIALLVEPSDHSRDFQTVVAQNAGYNLKQFHSRNQALGWLCE
jgi:hypothetical protein